MKTKRNNKKADKGVALIYAIVCLTVVMALCFLLLIVAYQLLATSNNKKKNLQAAEAAKSFSDVMEKKISIDIKTEAANDVYNYLKQNMDETKWPSFYTEDEIDGMGTALNASEKSSHTAEMSFRYFNLKGDGTACETSVCMYWVRTGTDRNGAILHVKTISTYGEQIYTVDTVYKLSITSSQGNEVWKWTLKSKMY